MIETVIIGITILTGIGAVAGAYQLLRIRLTLGPLFQGTLSSIITEHIFLGAVWVAAIAAFNLVTSLFDPSDTMRNWISLSLGLAIMLIVWVFVIRTHRWYRRPGNGKDCR